MCKVHPVLEGAWCTMRSRVGHAQGALWPCTRCKQAWLPTAQVPGCKFKNCVGNITFHPDGDTSRLGFRSVMVPLCVEPVNVHANCLSPVACNHPCFPSCRIVHHKCVWNWNQPIEGDFPAEMVKYVLLPYLRAFRPLLQQSSGVQVGQGAPCMHLCCDVLPRVTQAPPAHFTRRPSSSTTVGSPLAVRG